MPIICELPHNVGIVVPSTFDVSNVASVELISKVLVHVQSELCRAFGGHTSIGRCAGGWISDEGVLISEPVQLVTAFVSDEDFTGAQSIVVGLAEWVCLKMSQTCVLIVVDGKAKLVGVPEDRHACEDCGTYENVDLCVDPYIEEMWERKVERYLCDACYHECLENI